MDDDAIASPAQAMRARTFIIRCWHERSERRQPTLRGTLRDLAGGEHRTFEELEGLVTLLRSTLAGTLPVTPAPTHGDYHE